MEAEIAAVVSQLSSTSSFKEVRRVMPEAFCTSANMCFALARVSRKGMSHSKLIFQSAVKAAVIRPYPFQAPVKL